DCLSDWSSDVCSSDLFPRLRAEWHLTIEMLLATSGQQALLEQNPLLARSIKNRFPYLDPLNHVQIELLKRHRASDTDDRVVQARSEERRVGKECTERW